MSNINVKNNMIFNSMNNININMNDNSINNYNKSYYNQVNYKNSQTESNNSQNKDKEILNLKKELKNAKSIIEEQKITINNLQNKINNIYANNKSNIQIYENIINQKEKALKELTIELEYIKSQNNAYVDKNKMMTIDFIFADKKMHYSVPCIDTDIFAEVEEKLYKQFPEYRETNNNFIANGEPVLRFKTIAQNKIGNGLPVAMLMP